MYTGLKDDGLRLQAMWSSVINAIVWTAARFPIRGLRYIFCGNPEILVMHPSEYGSEVSKSRFAR